MKPIQFPALVIAAAALALSACGPQDGNTSTSPTHAVGPLEGNGPPRKGGRRRYSRAPLESHRGKSSLWNCGNAWALLKWVTPAICAGCTG